MTRVSLTAFAPDDCGRGHVLRGPGRLRPVGAMLVGWHPCTCPASMTAGGAWGHIRVRCTACLDEGIDISFYDPPCSFSGETDGRPDVPDGTGMTRPGGEYGG